MTEYVIRNGQRIAVGTLESTGTPTRRRRQSSEAFAQVPLAWAAKAAKATHTLKALVWIELLYAVWQAETEPVALSTERFRSIGVSHQTKLRALRELEAAGLVKVDLARPQGTSRVHQAQVRRLKSTAGENLSASPRLDMLSKSLVQGWTSTCPRLDDRSYSLRLLVVRVYSTRAHQPRRNTPTMTTVLRGHRTPPPIRLPRPLAEC